MSKQVNVKLFRKVTDTVDISCRIQSGAFEIRLIDVQKTIEFNQERYETFCDQFMEKLDCLNDLNYSNNRGLPVAVEIICQDKLTIYAVPEGFSYARYIGVDHIESKDAENDK